MDLVDLEKAEMETDQKIENNNNSEPEPGVSSDEESAPQWILNPLLIEKIVEKIFNYIIPTIDQNRTKQLYLLRSVCNSWNEEATRILEKSAIVRFYSDERVEAYLKYLEKISILSEEQEQDLSRLRKLRHTKFAIYGLRLKVTTNLKEFVWAKAHLVKTLILQNEHVGETELYWMLQHLPFMELLSLRVVPEITPSDQEDESSKSLKLEVNMYYGQREINFPNIKHFIIGTRSFEPPSVSRRIDRGAFQLPPVGVVADNNNVQDNVGETLNNPAVEAAFVKLLTSFPKLESFTCTCFDEQQCDENMSSKILQALIKVPASNLRGLKELNFPLYISQEVADAFINVPMCRLQSVGEITLLPDVRTNTVNKLLEIILKNLAKLDLRFPNISGSVRLSAENMENMKQLKLNKFGGKLDFLRNMNQLKSFCCTNMDLPFIFPAHLTSLTNLNEFKIHEEGHLSEDYGLLNRIGEAFPNLSVLHLSRVNDDCLYNIYLRFSHLKELVLFDSTVTDTGITGIGMEICIDALETLTYMVMNPVNLRDHLYIGNLHKLIRLGLESPKLTAVSVMWGINDCVDLRELYLKLGVDEEGSSHTQRTVGSFHHNLDKISVLDWSDNEIYSYGPLPAEMEAENPEIQDKLQHKKYRENACNLPSWRYSSSSPNQRASARSAVPNLANYQLPIYFDDDEAFFINMHH